MGLMFRRRRPVRTAAMLAAGGAVAYHAGKKRAGQPDQDQDQGQDQEGSGQPPAEAQAAPAAAPSQDLAGELERLGKLRDQGMLSPQEFDAAKQKLLGAA